MRATPDDLDLETLPPAALRSLVDEIAAFPPHSRDRGIDYALNGHVGPPTASSRAVQAVVHGSSPWRASWRWDGEDWYPQCSCPVGPICKHAYALACVMLEPVRARLTYFDNRAAWLLPPVRRAPFGGEARAPRDTSAATAPARPIAPASRGASPVGELRRRRDFWGRQQALLSLLRGQDAGFRLDVMGPPFAGILREADPDLMCWMLAREIPRHTDGWLPAALEGYVDRPDLEARAFARQREALAMDLDTWARRRATQAAKRLRAVLCVDASAAGFEFRLEARLSSKRLVDEPRTDAQLVQLRSEARRVPETLSPDEADLLDLLVDPDGRGITGAPFTPDAGFGLGKVIARFHDSALLTWDEDLSDVVADRAGVSRGDPVRYSRAGARLVLQCARDAADALQLELRVAWPDGRERAFADTLYVGGTGEPGAPPSLVLADGAFAEVLEEPPQSIVRRFEMVGSLPFASIADRAMLWRLATGVPSVRESLAPHAALEAMAPAVALRLRDDDWLQLRLFAHAASAPWRPGQAVGADTLLLEFDAGTGWEPHAERAMHDADPLDALAPAADVAPGGGAAAGTAPSPAQSGASSGSVGVALDVAPSFSVPDLEHLAPLAAWLAATGAEPGLRAAASGFHTEVSERAVGWWLRLGPRSIARFAEAWEARPPGVAWYGDDAARRMLGRAARIRPRVRIASSGVDWFAVSAEWEAEGMKLTDEEIAKLRDARTPFVRLPSGWVRRETAEVHDDAARVLADLGLEAGGGVQKLTLWQLASAREESLAALERMGADAGAGDALRTLRARIAAFEGLPAVAPPAALTAELRPYQLQGLSFLAHASSLGLGAVLADDMGLGKTVQALAWIEHLRHAHAPAGPTLVVCPTSVMHNWEREANRFAPGLRVLTLASGATRHALRREIPSHDLILTNYALLRRDLEAWKGVDLFALVLDEAQNIKNPDAAVARAARELTAPYRLALTGTPLENRALDLWSIMEAVNPGYLGDRDRFSARFDRADAPPHARALLGAKLRPVLLRRMKKEVAPDLPERIEERRDAEMTEGQRKLYAAELLRSRARIDALSTSPGGVPANKIQILAALTRLRQICCHPALAGGTLALGSGKFDTLFELLEPLLEEGHKVLLFSQFVECLKLLAAELDTRAIPHHLLTGKTTKRQQVVDAFQNDPNASVFLISLRAGGTGLNLTAASYVVLFDPWWNPAVEAQAIDRTHRIGQDRTVIAYRLLTRGSIEDKIWELQQRKADLARDVLGEDGFARTLTRADLDYLLADA